MYDVGRCIVDRSGCPYRREFVCNVELLLYSTFNLKCFPSHHTPFTTNSYPMRHLTGGRSRDYFRRPRRVRCVRDPFAAMDAYFKLLLSFGIPGPAPTPAPTLALTPAAVIASESAASSSPPSTSQSP